MQYSPPRTNEIKKWFKRLDIVGAIALVVIIVLGLVLVPGVRITDDDSADVAPGVAVWLKNYNLLFSKTVTVEVTLVFDNYETYTASRTFTLEPGEYTSEVVWVDVPTLTYLFHAYTWDSRIV